MSALDRLEALCEAATVGPWEACNANRERGGCQCGNVWSLPLDAPITSGLAANRRNTGEGFTDEQTTRNADFIAASRAALPALIAVARASERAVETGFLDVVGYRDACTACKAVWNAEEAALTGHDEDCPLRPFEDLAGALAALEAGDVS